MTPSDTLQEKLILTGHREEVDICYAKRPGTLEGADPDPATLLICCITSGTSLGLSGLSVPILKLRGFILCISVVLTSFRLHVCASSQDKLLGTSNPSQDVLPPTQLLHVNLTMLTLIPTHL